MDKKIDTKGLWIQFFLIDVV